MISCVVVIFVLVKLVLLILDTVIFVINAFVDVIFVIDVFCKFVVALTKSDPVLRLEELIVVCMLIPEILNELAVIFWDSRFVLVMLFVCILFVVMFDAITLVVVIFDVSKLVVVMLDDDMLFEIRLFDVIEDVRMFVFVILVVSICVVFMLDDVRLVLNKLVVVVLVNAVLVVTIKLFDDIDWNDPYEELICTEFILVESIVGEVIFDVIFKFDNIAEDPVIFVRMMLVVVMFDVVMFVDIILVVVMLVFNECKVLM